MVLEKADELLIQSTVLLVLERARCTTIDDHLTHLRNSEKW